MRTAAGVECRYYYEDFNRGRETQECRLIGASKRSLEWEPSDCLKCPVPEILRANGSPDMRLEATIKKRFGLLRTIVVSAHCLKHAVEIEDPILGCKQCTSSEGSW